MTVHVVLFEPKPTLDRERRREFLFALRQAVRAIPEVGRVRIGRISSVGLVTEQNIGTSTYSFLAILEFADHAALQRYLDHPVHQELRRLFWETCQSTIIADADLVDRPWKELESLVE